jgi:hypothetical protein
MCYRNLETAHHLFVECPASVFIWQAISSWCGRTSFSPGSWSDFVRWFVNLAGTGMDDATKGARSIAILVIWMIWCESNNRIFNNKERTLDNVLRDIKDTASMWCVAGAKKLATLVAFSSRE